MAVEIKRNGATVTISSSCESIGIQTPHWEVSIASPEKSVNIVPLRETVDVTSLSWQIDVTSGLIINGSPYEGEYEHTPSAAGDVLRTKTKTMLDDLTVNPIPYHETSNESGGYTVSIAS